MDESKEPGIRFGPIFLNRAMLEHTAKGGDLPLGGIRVLPEHKLTVTVASAISEDQTKGLITVTVQTVADDEAALYRFVVEMIGMVDREPGHENMTITEYLNTESVGAVIYPFLRETVANLTGRGRFGPVWLKPLNFKLMKNAPTMAGASAEKK